MLNVVKPTISIYIDIDIDKKMYSDNLLVLNELTKYGRKSF